MLIVYASRTGNVENFINKTGLTNTLHLETGNETVTEPFVLVSYTDGYGELPEEVEAFLSSHAHLLAGVAASGDQSYGDAYCLIADTIADMYGVPILGKFEFDGSDEDVTHFLEELEKL